MDAGGATAVPWTCSLCLAGATWGQWLGEAVTGLCLDSPGHGAGFYPPWLGSFLFSALLSKTIFACALALSDIPGRWEALQFGGLNCPFRGFLAFQNKC